MKQGCVQLYYGDGKGKTTAAMGQLLRCVGHGFRVLVYQFLKEPTSGEVTVLRTLPGVEYLANEGPIPFLFQLTEEQQEALRQKWGAVFQQVQEKYYSGAYDMVILDEVIDAYQLGIIDRETLHRMMEQRPTGTELVITGHDYGMDIDALKERADYVTFFQKEKHPFDQGLGYRIGIEE